MEHREIAERILATRLVDLQRRLERARRRRAGVDLGVAFIDRQHGVMLAAEPKQSLQIVLAGDRTLLATERTYAAWMRTALASLAAGVGSTAVFKESLPRILGHLIGTVLIVFAGVCLVAAIWRELKGTPITPHPDIKPIPPALLVPMNFFLMLVAVAALVGIWSS